MNVAGLSILTRKTLVTRRFGGDAWRDFFRDVARTHPCFRSLISAETLVPLTAYLAFHDELMRRFFKNDERSYMQLGRDSCRWALGEGPLKTLREGKDLASIVALLPAFHRTYLRDTTTWAEASLQETSVEFNVFEVPVWHPYFEYFIVGYIAEILEMFCANPIRAVLLQGGKTNSYRYLLHGAANEEEAAPVRRQRQLPEVKPLSTRELDALVLAAQGKTNQAIGASLGISPKTAQHHLAHSYRKIGVSNRVGATVWLAERGLLGGR